MRNNTRVMVRLITVLICSVAVLGAFPSLPLPTSGDSYVIDGWTQTIAMAIPCNLDGDDRVDWAGKSRPIESGYVHIEARTSSDKFLWDFNTGVSAGETQDSSGDHHCAVPWDIDEDGLDEVMTVKFEGSSRYMVVLDGSDGSVKGKVAQPSTGGVTRLNNYYCCIAYLDGPTAAPSVVYSSGIYNGSVVWAFDWDDDSDNLVHRWTFSIKKATSAHELLAYDLNGDGREEVLLGGTAITPDGARKWSMVDYGHLHMDGFAPGDLDPSHPGVEVYYHAESGVQSAFMVDADGKKLWEVTPFVDGDVHHGWACNVTDAYPGDECYALLKDGSWKALLSAEGDKISGITVNAHRPPEWTGDDVYDPELNLLLWGVSQYNGFSYAADVGGGENHGAEELILIAKDYRSLTIKFNRSAKSYPSRWANRHYRQDVVHCGAGYGALRATFQVLDQTVPETPPSITADPQDLTTFAGQTALFSVSAGGSSPLAYKWEKRPAGGSWATVSGATGSSYTTPALGMGDDGTEYRCVVSNSYGTATSAAAEVTVKENIAGGLTVGSGEDYTWAVLETGVTMYMDRDYTYSSTPSSLQGYAVLQTAMEDKLSSSSDGSFISFTVGQDATVYVLYTTVNTDLEDVWLTSANGWEAEDFSAACDQLGSGEETRIIKSKAYFAGSTVELGGNGGTSNATSMYTAVVVPGIHTGMDPDGCKPSEKMLLNGRPDGLYDLTGRAVHPATAQCGVYFVRSPQGMSRTLIVR